MNLLSCLLSISICFTLAGCVRPRPETAQLRFALACARGDLGLVKELMSRSVRIDVNNINGTIGPCLSNAAYGGHDEIIKFVLERGADVNVKDDKGTTPLINAVLGNNPRTVNLLLQNGADPKIVMPDDKGELTGITALTAARMKGNAEIIRMLDGTGDAK